MSKITITIEIEDGNVSVSSDKPSKTDKPFLLEPEDELTERPHYVTEDPSDLITEQANKFAHQFADKLVDNPIVGSEARESLVTEETLEEVEKNA